ncbi:sensor histidine kinase [Nocardia panacis]|uniref:histidine kinase n=1 Tax=Nocardia panacis TaxID=2340916 RepID=A0A3A4K8Y8_9NOCA|nr:HAMP domain-containing sensor histidine kinase [Nocardia panacis]RJO69482.1 sensor histidine kinase [Nocardia panacis]
MADMWERIGEVYAAVRHPARWGLRVRSALISGVAVAVVLLLGSAAVLLLVYRSLLGSVDAAVEARAFDIVGQLRDTAPDRLPAAVFVPSNHVEFVQVLDASGRVVRASEGAPDRVPRLAADRSIDYAAEPDSDLRVARRAVDDRYVVLVGADIEPVEETLRKVAVGLAVSDPVIIAVAAAAAYRLVGRSLSSVEAIRARVAGIGADRLCERVPVPPARDEIARLAVTMNAMLDRVEAGQGAQRRFVGDASHELRSPLATVIAALELGLAHPEVLDRELIGRTLLPEAERMRRLIEDLLTLAATDEHGMTLRTGDVDLDDLAGTAAQALRQRGGIEVRTELTPTRLRGDAGALERVARNLIDNAGTHAAAVVRVVTDRTDDHARLTVSDDGPGIPVAQRVRVFERFVRLDTHRARDTGGTGLGLAIVAQIVAAHGGTVTVGDAALGGAEFTVLLPLSPGD